MIIQTKDLRKSYVTGTQSVDAIKGINLDIEKNELIKKNFVPGLKVGKVGLEKSFEEKLIGSNDIERWG